MLDSIDEVLHDADRCNQFTCEHCQYERYAAPWLSFSEWQVQQERMEA